MNRSISRLRALAMPLVALGASVPMLAGAAPLGWVRAWIDSSIGETGYVDLASIRLAAPRTYRVITAMVFDSPVELRPGVTFRSVLQVAAVNCADRSAAVLYTRYKAGAALDGVTVGETRVAPDRIAIIAARNNARAAAFVRAICRP